MRERRYFVYIMASKPYGTLYVGVTNNVFRRAYEPREGLVDGFTKKFRVKTLVYFEVFPTALSAIHREKRMKKWPRAYKINLIMGKNPRWDDLFERVAGGRVCRPLSDGSPAPGSALTHGPRVNSAGDDGGGEV